MARNKAVKSRRSKSLEEIVEMFETQDMGDLWDEMPEAHFEVDIRRRAYLIEIDEKLARELTKIAKSKRRSSESLVNDWLKEGIARQKSLR
jgi:hypothetical protein